MHFEDIWNEAEIISKKFNYSTDEITIKLKEGIDKLENGLKLDAGQRAMLIGDILFELCAWVAKTESSNDSCNIAAGLQFTIDKRKAELLDPEVQS